ncbi:right-handed parallel beta-helix repeat-containing protein [Pedobacter sp. AW31-3R]|uniref:right-handed parallel beta-helix repeat-containing protein n=1 Tax=Pedobacter sp. AW31-3R TaxID=3445781 RepID=UPI003F9F0419
MNFKRILLFSLLVLFVTSHLLAQSFLPLYTEYKDRKVSPGKTTYYIDPQRGDDRYSGNDKKKPWRTFNGINQLILSPGDRVEILAAGTFSESLVLVARGNLANPVIVKFASGRYDIFRTYAKRKTLHISNTNDDPYEPKAIALMFDSCQFINVEGGGAKFVLRGKMIETFICNSSNIKLDGLSFDYERPTVSELTVENTGANYADLQIHPDSKFSIKDSLLYWEGEGWNYPCSSYWQRFHSESNYLFRIHIPVKGMRFVQTGENKIRVYYPLPVKRILFEKGSIYQTRDVERDCTGIFIQKSKNIELNNVRIYFMHGMGIVSQYCENIKINRLIVSPDPASGRTCAAWADILHFSGCRGLIDIGNSYLSAANDDAINIHGTHLLIKKKVSDSRQVQIKFMHDQTYGFDPFAAGDSLDFIRPKTLLVIGDNVVLHCQRLNDKEFLLTLKNPLPVNLKINDAVENTSATPQVWIHHNTIEKIPTRGILVTSRRRIIIEHNQFVHTYMSAILISDDASSWFESGMVRNLTIRNNNFSKCGEPVITILPENRRSKRIRVHSNILVSANTFDLGGLKLLHAKNTANLIIEKNIVKTSVPVKQIKDLIKIKKCKPVSINNNKVVEGVQL